MDERDGSPRQEGDQVMDLDEVDLNVIYEALHRKVATTTWNVEDDEEFQMLVHIKGLIVRIGEHLDNKR